MEKRRTAGLQALFCRIEEFAVRGLFRETASLPVQARCIDGTCVDAAMSTGCIWKLYHNTKSAGTPPKSVPAFLFAPKLRWLFLLASKLRWLFLLASKLRLRSISPAFSFSVSFSADFEGLSVFAAHCPASHLSPGRETRPGSRKNDIACPTAPASLIRGICPKHPGANYRIQGIACLRFRRKRFCFKRGR